MGTGGVVGGASGIGSGATGASRQRVGRVRLRFVEGVSLRTDAQQPRLSHFVSDAKRLVLLNGATCEGCAR